MCYRADRCGLGFVEFPHGLPAAPHKTHIHLFKIELISQMWFS